MQLNIRPITQNDHAFIISTWIEHLGKLNYYKRCPFSIVKKNFKPRICQVVSVGAGLVACAEDDDNQIFGVVIYSDVAQSRCVHWLYVKLVYRQLGIGQKLLNAVGNGPTQYSTASDQKIISNWLRANNLQFNPWGLDDIENQTVETSRIDQGETI